MTFRVSASPTCTLAQSTIFFPPWTRQLPAEALKLKLMTNNNAVKKDAHSHSFSVAEPRSFSKSSARVTSGSSARSIWKSKFMLVTPEL